MHVKDLPGEQMTVEVDEGLDMHTTYLFLALQDGLLYTAQALEWMDTRLLR